MASFAPMARTLVLLAVLAGCGSTRTKLTVPVGTLGYSHTPAVVIVGVGDEELVRPWLASMHASRHMTVVAEVLRADPTISTEERCAAAREAAGTTALDEILVVEASVSPAAAPACGPYAASSCTGEGYFATRVGVTTTVTAYRAATCRQLRVVPEPYIEGTGWARAEKTETVTSEAPDQETTEAPDKETTETTPEAAPIDAVSSAATSELPTDSSEPAEPPKPSAAELAARADALLGLQKAAMQVTWKGFPRDTSIQYITGRTMVVAGPLAVGEYQLNTHARTADTPSIRATSHSFNQTTFDVGEAQPEPGDELLRVHDTRTVAGYLAVVAGTTSADGAQHGTGGAAAALRCTWDKRPWLLDTQFGTNFTPGIDSRHVGMSFAAGLRFPYWITPIAFVEVGAGFAFQGSHGARTAAMLAGVGTGLEVRSARWYAFADVRLRGVALGDWEDSQQHPLEVQYTDSTWSTRTGQLGLGFHY